MGNIKCFVLPSTLQRVLGLASSNLHKLREKCSSKKKRTAFKAKSFLIIPQMPKLLLLNSIANCLRDVKEAFQGNIYTFQMDGKNAIGNIREKQKLQQGWARCWWRGCVQFSKFTSGQWQSSADLILFFKNLTLNFILVYSESQTLIFSHSSNIFFFYVIVFCVLIRYQPWHQGEELVRALCVFSVD